ncbi:type IX secretion system sortase PorU [Flavobacteriaceae bacterium]|nr:type IX secretion system sortase PorU [Flavobacteriaceae bacterium]MDC0496943.1 type IX secretion system sortase PorU [Flavobacteriaceae bacterium]
MKINQLVVFLFLINFCSVASQEKLININWVDNKTYLSEFNSFNVPYFDNYTHNFEPDIGVTLTTQWIEDFIIDPNLVSIEKINYVTVNTSEVGSLDINSVPTKIDFKLNNSLSKKNRTLYLEFNPFFRQDNVLNKVLSFSIQYNKKRSQDNQKLSTISNSVLSQGSWYKFQVGNSGVYKLSKSFLNDMGVNTNNIDPRTIKIFGNGGGMLPLMNSSEFPYDPIENAIKFIGEEDGVFNNDDYIIFYAKGQDTYNEESNTNLNSFTNETFYLLNVSAGLGRRVVDIVEPDIDENYIIDEYQDYKFHEVDNYNIAKIGRRWFGERFDFESIKNFEFEFDNLITSKPIDLKVYTAAVSEIPTSMSLQVNNIDIDNFNYQSINDPILASEDYFNNQISVSNSLINVTLDYNNNGNPSSYAYLDYISIEATCGLSFNGSQLIFYNNEVENLNGVGKYVISNSNSLDEVWNVTDISNITFKENSSLESNFYIKSSLGFTSKYIAFSKSDLLLPVANSSVVLANQNLKNNVFVSNNNDLENVDYLIVTSEEMLSQANRLADINRNVNNINVKVVDLKTIYNEFNSSNPDISAIRNFVKYVYDNSEGNLKYLCLFGDASYDYKDRIANNTNIVPSWHSLSSFSLSSSFISDDFFGMMDFNEGTMSSSDKLDIAVGRILADTPQRAKDLVDKIESYYSEESFGSWRNNTIVIADDVDESWEDIIQSTSDSLATIIEINKPSINIKKIYADAYVQESTSGGERYPEVNNAIVEGIEVGALVVNYFGHGGEDGIARERIFDKIDATELLNKNKLNCFVSVTCEFTKFDNPNRETAGEFLYWNKNGGAVGLITTTRQIFVSVGVDFNITLQQYLFNLNSNTTYSMAEALRLTKNDPEISNIVQRRLVFFIGDPAMKLAFPDPNIKITSINDIPVNDLNEPLKALSLVNIKGQVEGIGGEVLNNYNGELTSTVFDKNISRSTLANDNIYQNNEPIILDFTTLGETIFKGKASISNGLFEFNFVVPRDIGMAVDNGKFSLYAENANQDVDNSGNEMSILIGGINENAENDNTGPDINLYMNDESFIDGGITNENPFLIVKLFDENGINTSSGIGHDITAVLDGDNSNTFQLNDYYEAALDDYQNGSIKYPLRDLEPGLHTINFKAWDVFNNSSSGEIQFLVNDQNDNLVISNVLNYPNPFVNYTEFWFNHNSSDVLDVLIQIFTVSGKLVKTISQQTNLSGSSSLSRDLIWDGRDEYGDRLAKGVYVYKLKVRSLQTNKKTQKIQKLVIL